MGVVWSAEGREIASWLRSIRAFSESTVEGFAGEVAGKPLALNVNLRVGVLYAGRKWARPKSAPIPPHVFAVMNRRVRCGVGEGGRCDKGNGWLSLGKLDDPSFPAPVDVIRAWSRVTARIWCCHLSPAAASPTRTGHRPRLVEALALPGEMSAAAFFASWDRHRRRRPVRGFVSGRRLRIEPGPKGDAQNAVQH